MSKRDRYVSFLLRLSPEVFLKRPATENYWRLDEILKRKAVGILSVFLSSFTPFKLLQITFTLPFFQMASPLFEPFPAGTRSQSVCSAVQRGGASTWHK